MSGETNRLLGLAKQITEIPDERELDVIASTGEQVSVGLVALAIHAEGGKAVSLLGHQVRILTDSAFARARIQDIDARVIGAALDSGKIAVIAGFQGADKDGNITTLGRGGSDTSGVAIAAALKADACEIYTDVDGVYTADPNVVSTARKVDRISYEEMLELASLGAKVLQIRSVEFGMKYGVPDSRPFELQRQRRDMGRARGERHGISDGLRRHRHQGRGQDHPAQDRPTRPACRRRCSSPWPTPASSST